jgi:hypothetical protein
MAQSEYLRLVVSSPPLFMLMQFPAGDEISKSLSAAEIFRIGHR